MAKKITVKLNTAGVRELLKSQEMQNICAEHALAIMQRCGSGYEMDTYVGQNRVNAQVMASTYQAKADCMRNNTLLKALR